MNWTKISACDVCGGSWRIDHGRATCDKCGNTIDTETGWFKLDTEPPLPDLPAFKGQIGDPSPQYVKVFRDQYVPIMTAAGLDMSALRVLELGAGIGRTSQAFIAEYAPALYIATEPFSSLAATLRENLNGWGYAWPKGVAANYNANHKPLLQPKAVNVIIGNSVLHHILDFEDGLRYWSEILDRPGVMIFGEPLKEGWVYWTSLVLAVLKATDMQGFSLAPRTVNVLRRHAKVLTDRLRSHKDRNFLSGLDDKHMFSPLRMMAIADSLGMSLAIHKANRNTIYLMQVRLERIGIDAEDVRVLMAYLRDVVPPGFEDTAMSDFAAMFVFRKI